MMTNTVGQRERRPKVLIVEDEVLLAMLVQDMLDALGFDVGAIASSLGAALHAGNGNDVDVAILDVNLNGRSSGPVAEILLQRGIPFIFATGYGPLGPHDEFPSVPVLHKPFGEAELMRTLSSAMGKIGR